jgi:hypothetical protein
VRKHLQPKRVSWQVNQTSALKRKRSDQESRKVKEVEGEPNLIVDRGICIDYGLMERAVRATAFSPGVSNGLRQTRKAGKAKSRTTNGGFYVQYVRVGCRAVGDRLFGDLGIGNSGTDLLLSHAQ